MHGHQFIFEPGEWLGEGDVELSIPTEPLKYYAHWKVSHSHDGKVHVEQKVEMAGISEPMQNTLSFQDLSMDEFSVDLENPLFGKIRGKGLVSEESISWEFKQGPSEMEGFEMYEKIDAENYGLRAEYVSDEHLRTVVKGKIWRKK